MMGVKNLEMLRRNLDDMEKGPMAEEELAMLRAVGDQLYGRR